MLNGNTNALNFEAQGLQLCESYIRRNSDTSMDASAASWLSDLLLRETENCNLFRQCDLSLVDDEEELLLHDMASGLHEENLQHPLSSERPTKQLKASNCGNPKQNKAIPVSPPQPKSVNFTSKPRQTKSLKGQGSHAQDHIMAERKRRERLSQSLIALAALIPGLKKMDKASVLGNAIRYVKELQERLRLLEEQSKNRDMESVVMVNKPQLCYDDHSPSRDDGKETLPHVEARVSQKDVLLRIHCQNQKGLLLKILFEIQNLHLFVVNSSVLPFGDSILDITIVAQMGTGYNLTINDLVKNLRVATTKSMS